MTLTGTAPLPSTLPATPQTWTPFSQVSSPAPRPPNFPLWLRSTLPRPMGSWLPATLATPTRGATQSGSRWMTGGQQGLRSGNLCCFFYTNVQYYHFLVKAPFNTEGSASLRRPNSQEVWVVGSRSAPGSGCNYMIQILFRFAKTSEPVYNDLTMNVFITVS